VHGGRAAEPAALLAAPGEEDYRARIREIVREINESAAAARAESLIAPLGVDGVRAQNPETRPRKIKKSPAPSFHALRKKVRKALREAYGLFFAAFHEAAEKLRVDDRDAAVPSRELPASAAVRDGLSRRLPFGRTGRHLMDVRVSARSRGELARARCARAI